MKKQIYVLDHYYSINHEKQCIVIEIDKTVEEMVEITSVIEFLLEYMVEPEAYLEDDWLLECLEKFYNAKNIKSEIKNDFLYELKLPIEYVFKKAFIEHHNIMKKCYIIDLFEARESCVDKGWRDENYIDNIMDKWLPKGEKLEEIKTLLLTRYREQKDNVSPEDDNLVLMSESATIISIFDTPIESLGLSTRTYNCLKRGGINTVGQVLKASDSDLFKIKNMGIRSIDEIHQALYQFEQENNISPANYEYLKNEDTNTEVAKNIECEKVCNAENSIELLDLSARAKKMLKKAGINTIAQVLTLSVSEVLNTEGLDKTFSDEIFEKLRWFKCITDFSDVNIVRDAMKPINSLGLSLRTTNCLRRGGINTVGQLISLSKKDLMKINNLGYRTFSEITEKLCELEIQAKFIDEYFYRGNINFKDKDTETTSEFLIEKPKEPELHQKNINEGTIEKSPSDSEKDSLSLLSLLEKKLDNFDS